MSHLPDPVAKVCTTCHEEKPASAFSRDTRGGLRSKCRSCASEYARRRAAERRAEMGDEAWLRHQRIIVQRSRTRTGNTTGRAYMRARWDATAALIERHRREFDHLFLLAQRGELDEEAAS